MKTNPGREQAVTLDNGHTEAWLEPPAASLRARLELVDHASPGHVLACAESVVFRVER